MFVSTRVRLLLGALISLPAIGTILYFAGDYRVMSRVVLAHTLIFDALTVALFVSVLQELRNGKRLTHPVDAAHQRRLILSMAFFGGNALFTGLAVAIIPLEFSAAAALIIGIGIVTAPVIAASLLHYSFQLNRKLGKVWVKALDFPYLLFAFVGLMRVVANVWYPSDPTSFFNTFALVFLSLALSIRLAKAIIEVFFDDWVRSPKA